MKPKSYIFESCLFFVLLAGVARAQVNSQLMGIVTNTSGMVVPKASGPLTDTATSKARTTVPGGAALYTISNLGISTYTLTVVAAGFRVFQKTKLILSGPSNTKESASMTVGKNSQTVTVRANASHLQSESNEVSDLITGKQLTELAPNGRDVT